MARPFVRSALLGLLFFAIVPALSVPIPEMAHAQEGGDNLTGIKLGSDEPILIESDRLEVRENDHIAIFTGNVSVVQGDTLLKARKLTVYYAKDGGSAATGSADIERLVAEGKVYVRSKDQIATGERGTYDMKAEVMVLTGKSVVLTQGENSAVGCKLTIQSRSGLAHLESCEERVKILISPKSVEQ
jgi:lipopolysaccharide export system protein LptA